MSINGNWKLTMKTPMGEQIVNVALTEQGGALTGTMTAADGEAVEVKEGKAEGDRLTWQANVTKPMALKLHFDVKISGDALDGTFRPGMFPPSPVSGVRA